MSQLNVALEGAEVGAHDEIAKLQHEVRITRALLDEIRGLASQAVVPAFAQMLLQERRRSERYNHYFCLVTVASANVGPAEILKRARRALRSSDLLGLVARDGGGAAPRADEEPAAIPAAAAAAPVVGIILPETDRRGGQVAVDRMSSSLADAEQVTIRLAVYPEDSTDVADLLALTAS